MFREGPIPAALHEHRWKDVLLAQFPYETLVRFGGSDSSLVLAGGWWRLVTGTVLHANLLHIAINLFCLWNLGLFAERLLGRAGTVAVYFLTGTAGNLLSLAGNVFARRNGLVVGASGAVFGIAAILFVLLCNNGLTTKGADLRDLKILRLQVALFALVNYLLGVVPGYLSPAWLARLHIDQEAALHVDNSAHLGGLLFGLLLGIGVYPAMLAGKQLYRTRQAIVFGCSAFGLAMAAYAVSVFANGR